MVSTTFRTIYCLVITDGQEILGWASFPLTKLGQGLYRKAGFREMGVFQNQGKLDGTFVDVMAIGKLL
jgi:hypothetical protein